MPIAAADFGVIVIALVAALILWAAGQMGSAIAQTLAQALEGLPFGIAGALRSFQFSAPFSAWSWARAAVAPLAWTVGRTWAEFDDWINHTAALGTETVAAIVRVARVQIPALELRVGSALTAEAAALWAQIRADASAAAGGLHDLELRVGSALTAEAAALWAQIRADAASLGAELGALRVLLVAAVAEAEARAAQLSRDLVGRLSAEAGRAIEAVEGRSVHLWEQAEGDIAQARTQAEAYADQAAAGAEARSGLAVGAAAAAGAAALSQVASRVRAIEGSPCQQECATLGGLGAELDLLEFGLILGLVEAIGHNPAGAVAAVEADAAASIRDAYRLLSQLIRAA